MSQHLLGFLGGIAFWLFAMTLIGLVVDRRRSRVWPDWERLERNMARLDREAGLVWGPDGCLLPGYGPYEHPTGQESLDAVERRMHYPYREPAVRLGGDG